MDHTEIRRLAIANPDVEYWLPLNIDGLSEFYHVSSHGRMISYRPRNGIYTEKNTNSGRYLIPQRFKSGYLYYSIQLDCKNTKILIHRAVAVTFINSEDNAYDVVNHIDGNKENNKVTNLEWCTQSHNIIHSYKVLKRKSSHAVYVQRNGKSPTSKISRQQAVEVIRLLSLKKHTQTEIANMLCIKRKQVECIHLGVTWKHLPRD